MIDEIYRLREKKQNALVENAEREGRRQRVAEMTAFLNEQSYELKEYDEQLVRRLIEKVSIHDAEFGSDFIIRAALILYGEVVKSNISKQLAEELKNNWNEFKKTFKNLEIVLKGMKIEVSHFSSNWNVLLPIAYFIYYNPNYNNNIDGIRTCLVRKVLFTYFQSGTTGNLLQMKSSINSNDQEITVDMLEQMNDLRVTDGKTEDILNAEKGSRVAGEALYYLSLDWIN